MTPRSGEQTDLARRVEARIRSAGGKVERWLLRNEKFRAMCEEYDECVRALEKWRAMAEMHGSRKKEFETLARELEDEIRGFLAAHRKDPGERR